MTAAEREREKKKTAREYISIGFPKKKCFGNFTFSKGSLFFSGPGRKNTQFAEEETTFNL